MDDERVGGSAQLLRHRRVESRLGLAEAVDGLVAVREGDEITEIEPALIERADLNGVERVLFHTHNSSLWNEGFRKDFTHLLPEAAQMLIELGIKLIGTDYLSIEKFHSGHHRTHLALLSNNVVIVEGLNLSEVPEGDYELICLPLKIAEGEGDGAPARAVLRTL